MRKTEARLRAAHSTAARPRGPVAGVYFAATGHDKGQPVTCTWTTSTFAPPDVSRNTTTRAPASVRPRSMKGSTTTACRTASACKSAPPIACTARPATSRTRTRSSPGSRPRAAPGRITRICRSSRPRHQHPRVSTPPSAAIGLRSPQRRPWPTARRQSNLVDISHDRPHGSGHAIRCDTSALYTLPVSRRFRRQAGTARR